MLFSASFLANAGLNFLLGLAIAAVLGPEEFGRYALAAAIGILANALCLFWIANATARFYSERTRREEPSIRATLDRAALVLSLLMLAATLLVLVAWPDWGLPRSLVGLALVVGIGHGLFDYASALSRARFMERVFARIVIAKNVIGFGMMLGAAWAFHDAHAVLAALAISTILSLIPVAPILADRTGSRFDPAHLATFLAYAGPHVSALAIYQLIPFINRSLLAQSHGYAESGQFSLTFDTLYRIFAAIGSSLDYILFQFAVRDEETGGREAAERRLGLNLVIVLGALAPALAGFWLVLPWLAALVVPADFRAGFVFYGVLLLPAVLAQSFVVSALNAVFQIRKRTVPIVLVALAALAANALLAGILPRWLGTAGYPLAQSGAMLLVLVATLVLAWPVLRRVVPLRDVAGIMGATGLMIAALWPLRSLPLPAWAGLGAMVAMGAVAYLAALTLADVGGLRRGLERRLSRRSASGCATLSD
jgi:O-antigen/teichoic acid export membrane protein